MTPHTLAQLSYLAAALAAAAAMAAALRRHGSVLLRHRRPDLPLPPEHHARLFAQGLGLVAQGFVAMALLLAPVAADAAEGLRSASIMIGAALIGLAAIHYATFAEFARPRAPKKVLAPLARRSEPSGCFVALAGAAIAVAILLGFAVLANGWRGVGQLCQILGVLLLGLVALLCIPGLLVAAVLHVAGMPDAAVVPAGVVAEILFWYAVVTRLRARRAERPLNSRLRPSGYGGQARFHERRTS